VLPRTPRQTEDEIRDLGVKIDRIERVRMSELRSKDAEIDRLKAELDLRTRERDQAIEFARIDFMGIDLYSGSSGHEIGSKFPELYAHLAGRGE
jgi:hypothetical protein